MANMQGAPSSGEEQKTALEQYGVDHGEDGRIGADSQRQGGHCGQHEAPIFTEHARSVLEVLQERFKHRKAAWWE